MSGVVEAFKETIEPEPNTRSQTRMVGTKQLNDLLDYVERLERDRSKLVAICCGIASRGLNEGGIIDDFYLRACDKLAERIKEE